MLGRFALSAAPSRNWAGYWEIDRTGQPSTADFLSNDDFLIGIAVSLARLNLPASESALRDMRLPANLLDD